MAALEWKVIRSIASGLEKAMLDLEAEGYEVARIMAGDDPTLQVSIGSARGRHTDEFVIVGKKPAIS